MTFENFDGQKRLASPRLLFVITEDWFFASHFIERAVAAQQAGYEVAVATRIKLHGEQIRNAGIALFQIDFSRRGLNPFIEIRTAWRLRHIVRKFAPDVIHNIALKPVVVGTLGERLAGHKEIVNAPVGMGYLFSSQDRRATMLRPIFLFILRHFLNPSGSQVIIENPDDYSSLIDQKMVHTDSLTLIKGAGVDTKLFTFIPEPAEPVVVTIVARMLQDKGISEFVEAAALIRKSRPETIFQLIGMPDEGNPTSFSLEQLEDWVRSGAVKWLGHQDNIAEHIAKSHIICLPSYREGLPKSLIEAVACGRPVVTTDVPGCREVVSHGVNGFLVQPRDSHALAEALMNLISDSSLRERMGRLGRERAEKEFSSEIIIGQTLRVYESMLTK
jgi:glycosyltransferase involved in cell wall biosynthesis